MTDMTISVLTAIGWEQAQGILRDSQIEFSAGSADGEGQLSEYWIIVAEEDCARVVDLLQEREIETGIPMGPTEPLPDRRRRIFHGVMLAAVVRWLLLTLPGAILSLIK